MCDGRTPEFQRRRASRLHASEFRFVPVGAFLHCPGHGDAVGRGRLAGLRDHEAPTGSWPGRSRTVSSRHPVIPGRGTRCGSLQPPQTDRCVLRRIRFVLRIALLYRAARNPLGLCDLWCPRPSRRGSLTQRARKPCPASAASSRRAFSKRDFMGLQRISIRHDSGPVTRRACLRGLSRSDGRIRSGHDGGDSRRARRPANQNAREAAPA